MSGESVREERRRTVRVIRVIRIIRVIMARGTEQIVDTIRVIRIIMRVRLQEVRVIVRAVPGVPRHTHPTHTDISTHYTYIFGTSYEVTIPERARGRVYERDTHRRDGAYM